jgi:large subunit ribosomal protein L6
VSRIGKQPIPIPAGVKVQLANGKIQVEGPKGKLELAYHRNIRVEVEAGKTIKVFRPDDERQNRALHGLTRSLINNMVQGVTKGFEKKLVIEGIGYQARLDKKALSLTVGYSHAVDLTPPEGVTVEVSDPQGKAIRPGDAGTLIIIRGADRQAVGEFAAQVRGVRTPEPYKGKGIRYDSEVVRRKEGKAFTSGTT